MANAPRDDNHVPGLLAALNTTGTSVVPVKADPTTHSLAIDDGTTGSDHGPVNALRDGNNVPGAMALSSAGDGSLVSLYATAAGELLIDSM